MAQNYHMIDKAIAFALKAHTSQVDKTGQPYILHCLRVAAKFTGDREMYSAAVMHDVVEDSSITIAEIEDAFGSRVSGIVDGLTRRKGEVYLTGFIKRCNRDPLAKVIKTADILDNLEASRAIYLPEEERIRLGRRYFKALKYFAEN